MYKVLMIANQFPPMGGSGVQRTSKFVKHLQSFGYLPVVLTRDINNMKLIDKSLMVDIPQNVHIVRTPPFDLCQLPFIFSLLGKFVARKILIPDGERIWALFTQKKALKIIAQEKIDIIYTTSYPYSDHLLGCYIKQKMPHIKWVADFRDEWTNNPYTLDNPHNFFRTSLEKKMELKVLTSADIVVTNTPIMKDNFINILKNSANSKNYDNFYVIPNGYDNDDFESFDCIGNKPNNDKFTITYTGALYGRRKPDTFFYALSLLLKDGLIDRDKISVIFIGNFKKLSTEISSFGLNDVVSVLGYLPHNECLSKMINSDALLLLEGNGPGAEAFYTGKVFEYMKTNRPVLAVIPKLGVAAKLIAKTNIGVVADFSDIKSISECILNYYIAWKNNALTFSPVVYEIEKYERKNLTQMLACLFDSCLNVSNCQ